MKTQTNVRYHLALRNSQLNPEVPNRVVTTVYKTGRLVLRTMRKFVSQPGEALLLCRMAWWVTVLSVVARCYSLPRALAIVAGRETVAGREIRVSVAQDPLVQERLARAIDLLLSADVFQFKPICWKRAAVLHRYLSRHGISTRIIFGVRNESDGKVAGHAWLESGGEPILESAPPEYLVTYRFPSNEHFDPAEQGRKGATPPLTGAGAWPPS